MTTKTKPPKPIHDPDGEAWHAEAAKRWDAAVAMNPDAPLAAYEPHPLPDFAAGAPAHITREVLGRFLEDRDTGTLHDVYAATEACGVDGIRNGTWYHFGSECPAGLTRCGECVG